jgi:putative molybdopterin biosynthesis protein
VKPERTIYLHNISLDEALSLWLDELDSRGLALPLDGETIPVEESIGRVTAEAVYARTSSPHNNCAAMDGYAVRFREAASASESEPIRLQLGSQALAIDTGEPIPEGYDAVIMVEDVDPVSEGEIEITAAVTPWQHIRTVGEDIVATELVLPENHVIRPVDIAAMLAGGLTEVSVRVRPTVTIIPTGSELVEPGTPLERGDIIEFNSRLLSQMADQWGASTQRRGIIPDDPDRLKETVAEAVTQSRLVVINAGSSAGREDFTVGVMRELGEVLAHGVRIKPGKPVALGVVADTPVLGIPGYPVSAALDMELFARPLIFRLQGRVEPERTVVSATVPRKIASGLGAEEFVRVKLGDVGGRLVATPVERGAGALMSLVRADGILRIPEDSEGIRQGRSARVELLNEPQTVRGTIIAVGSHDISLDILGSELRRNHPALSLAAARVGSLGGLMALRRGEAHLAGTHLLDPETGRYNTSYVQRYLDSEDVHLINLVYREQGIIVPPGNPLGIRGVADLAREDVVFINRQQGAGTRVLLDYELGKAKVDAADISGYEREEFSHMTVAAAVKDGAADAGMGILAAARALELDFIPVALERFDLAIPGRYMESDHIQALLSVMRQEGFRAKVENLGGYDASHAGEQMS